MSRSAIPFVQVSRINRVGKIVASVGAIGLSIGLPLLFVPHGVQWWQSQREQTEIREREPAVISAVQVFHSDQVGVTISKDRWKEVGLGVAPVVSNAERRPLKMEGVLYLDPDDYAQIRSRFSGEIVEVPEITDEIPQRTGSENLKHRSLRFGDQVKKGDLLAVVWSRDLGEKKSEFSETLARLAFSRESLARLTAVRDSIPVNTLRDAERRVREEELAAERIEKTLLTWQLTREEIQQLRTELINSDHAALAEKQGKTATAPEYASVGQWARVELRSPIDGTIVEKNITVGTLVNPEDMLFKVANLTHLDVRAFAYEEDLAALQLLSTSDRKWTIRLQGDTTSKPIEGYFDRISSLIDPVQHTGLVMGWVDNSDMKLRPGQFVTVSIAYPDSEPLLCVPAASVVDLDANSYVLLQDPKNAEKFIPTRVSVVRFQDGLACLKCENSPESSCTIKSNSIVVTEGALGIIAECREHLRAEKDQSKTGLSESGVSQPIHRSVAANIGAVSLQ